MADDTPVLLYPVPTDDGLLFLPDTAHDEALTHIAISLRNADKNNDGRLSRIEATHSTTIRNIAERRLRTEKDDRAVEIIPDKIMEFGAEQTDVGVPSVPRAFVLQDAPLFDTYALNAATHRVLGLSLLPKNVENIMLSDFCAEGSSLACQNLPHGKILVNVKAPLKL